MRQEDQVLEHPIGIHMLLESVEDGGVHGDERPGDARDPLEAALARDVGDRREGHEAGEHPVRVLAPRRGFHSHEEQEDDREEEEDQGQPAADVVAQQQDGDDGQAGLGDKDLLEVAREIGIRLRRRLRHPASSPGSSAALRCRSPARQLVEVRHPRAPRERVILGGFSSRRASASSPPTWRAPRPPTPRSASPR
ncbi:MAG TPA: hypothetical protein VMS55_08620 [Myxococcota bacterium]|nr:hypothetical protein [Myxococcota bacterium]